MNQIDIIKEYLVSLGFHTDQASYAKMQKTLTDLTRLAESQAPRMAKAYVGAAGLIVGAIASITSATAALLEQIAQADLGYKKFALRMYMTEDAAKRMKIATDALGESLDDIAWIPELRERYSNLMSQQGQMKPPGDFAAQMRYIRDIRFEFTRLRVEMTYGAQWIGSYLLKYLNVPISDFYGWMKSLNDYLTAKMPEWTEKVAAFLANIFQLAGSAKRGLGELVDVFKSLWDRLDDGQKKWVALGAALWIFTKMGPFGRAVTVVTTLITLLDDFYAYIDGRKSSKALAPIWDQLLGYTRMLSKAFWGLWEAFGHATNGDFRAAATVLGNTWAEFKEAGLNVSTSKGEEEFIQKKRQMFLVEHWNEAKKKAGLGYFTPFTPENIEKVMPYYKNEMDTLTPGWREEYQKRNQQLKGDTEAHKARLRGEKTTSTSPERVRDLMGYMITEMGMKPHEAAGAVGSLMGESTSRLDPGAVEKPGQGGIGGSGGIGLAQWTGSRRRALEAFAAARGKPVTDWETQKAFLKYEYLNDKTTQAALGRTTNAGEASRAWTDNFEKPKEATAGHGRRLEYAEEAYKTWQAGSNAPYATGGISGSAAGNIDASLTINGGINVQVTEPGATKEEISKQVIEDLEAKQSMAEARALREFQPVFS